MRPMNLVACSLLFSGVLLVRSVVSEENQSEPSSDKLSIGTAAVDITPRLGTPMAGYYSPRGADGVHDPLMAKAMVLDDGTTRVALVSLDLIKTTAKFVNEARQRIASESGIPAEAVMIAATHSHTGPVIASGSDREDDFGGQSPEVVEYTARLPESIALAVADAVANLQPVKVSGVTGHCEGIAFNRRFHMHDGSVGWNPGKLNPKIVRAAGPVDEDIPSLLFTDLAGERKAALVNYSIHLDTTGGTQISADMPGALTSLLADSITPDFFTLYFTACCGDVNHIDVSRGGRQQGSVEATRIGTILAASTLQAFEQSQPIHSMKLAYESRQVMLPSYPVTEEQIVDARTLLDKQRTGGNASFREIVAAYRALDVDRNGHQPWEVEVQVITLGDQAAIVSLPGEIFVELGTTIRRGSPYPLTAVAELANGCVGYVPNRVAYPQGEYEVISARVAEGSGELLVDTALDMLRSMYEH
ncbi:MAG: neutral/alkaline non-lysosomal ceramidase N-terminal domain-containing protein [Aureliella sp.]